MFLGSAVFVLGRYRIWLLALVTSPPFVVEPVSSAWIHSARDNGTSKSHLVPQSQFYTQQHYLRRGMERTIAFFPWVQYMSLS